MVCLAIFLTLFEQGCQKSEFAKLDAFKSREKLLPNEDFQAYVLNLHVYLAKIKDPKAWVEGFKVSNPTQLQLTAQAKRLRVRCGIYQIQSSGTHPGDFFISFSQMPKLIFPFS